MSSIVRKSSHFTPKIRKRVERKKAPETPPATQKDAATQALSQDVDQENAAQTETPPTTQAETAAAPVALENYNISEKRALAPLEVPAAELDPKLKAPIDVPIPEQAIAEESESDGENYGDNDIFKQPQLLEPPAQRRRSSVAGNKRLSGIVLRRSSSISMPGTPAGTVTFGSISEDSHDAPVKIGIPVLKPARKRRLSVLGRSARKMSRSGASILPSVSDTLPEAVEEREESEVVSLKPVTKDPELVPGDALYVVGLDDRTQKFKKYKTSALVAGDFPVAPLNLVTKITSITQIPRNILKEDAKLFAQAGILTDIPMKDLCKPTLQIGQVSDKFEMAETARIKLQERKLQRRMARESARENKISYEEALRAIQGDQPEDAEDQLALNSQADAPLSSLRLILVKDQLTLDLETQVVSKATRHEQAERKVETESFFENPVTSNSYTKLTYTDSWTTQERIELYNALSTWGTDFTFIAQLFPHRTRRQIKSKYILEEKKNPELIELALKKKLPPDFESFRAKAAKNASFKTIEEHTKEMDQIEQDHRLHLEEINAERERAIKEDLAANREREFKLRAGTRRLTKSELRKNEEVVGTIDDVKQPRELRNE